MSLCCLHIPIAHNFHHLTVGMPAETATAIMSLLLGGILERFPRLKVCFAHGGGSFPYTVGRIQHGFLVRPDLCAQVGNLHAT